ncbi:Myb-like DNA-binding domain protein [Aspergillus undulatus]|uniref:Myb-like DNA-binding domain protein n=1 Tax=Aspergillus undulatus TaxID=1810928 RepID=UPI003CCD2A00
MDAPLKRKRLSLSPEASDENSDVDLHEARAQNDMRLKSIFEGIFEKYGRDFTDVGDEIDLQTGDITVNNGHVNALNMGGESHAGPIDWLSDPEGQAPSNEDAEQGDEEGQDTGAVPEENGWHPGRKVVSILSEIRPDPERSKTNMDGHGDEHGDGDGDADGDSDSTTSEAEYFDDRSSVDSLLDTALSVQGPQGTRTTREVRQRQTVTEKANPALAQTSQSHAALSERLDETVDPIWRVPKISAKFTTPTLLSRSRSRTEKPIVSTSAVRAQSPPGTGSIWALPWTARRNTDGVKKKRVKQKDGPRSSPTKKRKKHHSSPPPPIVCDWSFADTPDGSESDDPLQEDYEPSPTPKGSFYIREKRKGPFSAGATKSTNTTTTICSFCKKTFSKDDYVAHVRAVLADPADNEHNSIVLKSQLATVTTDHSATGPFPDATSAGEPIVRPPDTPTSTFDSRGQETANESTPSGNKRARTALGPVEARLIIRMKQVEGMKWKEILSHLPQKKLSNIQAWHHLHWNQRKANPPQSSGPWSTAELDKLEMLKDQPELTWPGIRAELPGRLLAEIEFKLLQLWAGDAS